MLAARSRDPATKRVPTPRSSHAKDRRDRRFSRATRARLQPELDSEAGGPSNAEPLVEMKRFLFHAEGPQSRGSRPAPWLAWAQLPFLRISPSRPYYRALRGTLTGLPRLLPSTLGLWRSLIDSTRALRREGKQKTIQFAVPGG